MSAETKAAVAYATFTATCGHEVKIGSAYLIDGDETFCMEVCLTDARRPECGYKDCSARSGDKVAEVIIPGVQLTPGDTPVDILATFSGKVPLCDHHADVVEKLMREEIERATRPAEEEE